MKRNAVGGLAVLLVAVVLAIAAPIQAHDYDRGNSDNPLRVVAYLLHPIGIGLEYGIMRPIHMLATKPHWRILMGHAPRNAMNEQFQYPVCPSCRPEMVAVECPHCGRPMLKPPDELWVWR